MGWLLEVHHAVQDVLAMRVHQSAVHQMSQAMTEHRQVAHQMARRSQVEGGHLLFFLAHGNWSPQKR
jgi:hypothetical protein